MDFSIATVMNQLHGAPERHHEMIEQARACERLGFDCYWFTEHHFEEYGRPNPELMAAYALACTSTIDIGIAIVVLPWHNPVHVAETIATLDHLGRGRFRFGIGRGNQPHEFAGHGIPLEEARPRFEEAYTIIKGLWENDTFSYDGQFWKVPEVRLLPKPYSTPHPSIWQPAVSEASIRGIVQKGINGLIGPYLTPFDVLKERYFDVWHEAKAQAGRADLRMAHNEFVHVAPTCEQASREAEPAAMWYVRKAAELWGSRDASGAPADYAYLAPILDKFASLTWEEIYEHLSIIGDSQRAIDRIREFEAAGVDELILFAGMGPQLTPEMSLRSLELFGQQVIPHFKNASHSAAEAGGGGAEYGVTAMHPDADGARR